MIQYLIIFILVVAILVFLFKRKTPSITRSVIINLDYKPEQFKNTIQEYEASDLSQVPIERFSAIVGSKLDITEYLDQATQRELLEVEETGYRTKHHQLTRGAIGCYLSHMEIYKSVRPGEIVLVLEDDIKIKPDALKSIVWPIGYWDILLLGHSAMRKNFDGSVKSFWGMFGYLITYEGAQKILKKGHPIDCQIDTFLSWYDDIIVRALKNRVIKHNRNDTDIQTPTRVTVPDSFIYRGKVLQL
jgi:glycosyl transferase family 25